MRSRNDVVGNQSSKWFVGHTEVGQKRGYGKLGGIAVEFFLIHAAILWDTLADLRVRGTLQRKAFSYNKRTMDRAMGRFWHLWQFLESITYVLSTC